VIVLQKLLVIAISVLKVEGNDMYFSLIVSKVTSASIVCIQDFECEDS